MPDTHTHRSPAAADTEHAAHGLGSMSEYSLICDGVIPQQNHLKAKYHQWKLHLIPLAYWASQMNTLQCNPTSSRDCTADWESLLLMLLPRQKAFCSHRKHTDNIQESANLKL